MLIYARAVRGLLCAVACVQESGGEGVGESGLKSGRLDKKGVPLKMPADYKQLRDYLPTVGGSAFTWKP